MIEITLLRHVKVAGPAALYGKTDVAAQLAENEKFLSLLTRQYQHSTDLPLEYIVSSPLQRCRILAEQLSSNLHCSLKCIAGFQEMNFGEFDGVPFDSQTEQHWVALEQFWQAPASATLPKAESLTDFHQRVVSSWQLLIEQAIENDNKKILLICHGGVIRMILADILSLDWKSPSWYQALKIEYASTSKVSVMADDGRGEEGEQNYHSVVNYIGLPLLSIKDEL